MACLRCCAPRGIRLNSSKRTALQPALLTIAIATLWAGSAATSTPVADHAERWWTHVRALADDSMEGRRTGSPGHRRAAEYVARVFHEAGLDPAGSAGFLQTVKFRSRTIDERRSTLALVRDGLAEPLLLGDDASFSMRIDSARSIDAPIVFVGRGLSIPERQIDDLSDIDVRGSVVVYFNSTPRSLPATLQAHFGSAAERWKHFREAGAIGTISVAAGPLEVPWARSAPLRLEPQLSLMDPSLDEHPGQQVAIAMNPARADKLFGGSGHTFEELATLERSGRPLPRFRLPARLHATISVDRAELESQNVLGVLPGSDPRRRGEFVVLSAHLDHLGVGAPVNGDAIYNGAMDNASGIAAILEIASELHESAQRPARSILFAAVTGEEDGELGSRYFVAHPTIPPSRLAADINTDMFLPLFPLKELLVLGLDESSLGDDVRAIASQRGIAVQGDPEPERNRFIRSDQYSFIRAGVPAIAMKVGYLEDTPEADIARQWTKERYHAPSDDVNQHVDMEAAAAYIDIVRSLAMRVANRPDRPTWSTGSFFRRFAAQP